MYSKQERPYSDLDGQKDLLTPEITLMNPVEYAGFWLRFAAYFIDAVIVWIAITIFFLIFGIGNLFLTDPEKMSGMIWGPIGILYLGVFLYFPLMESSKWQATLGKRAVGIIVTDATGERLSFLRALGRTLGKILSFLIIYIGFIMAGITDKKQALHDMLANALVIKGVRS